MPTLALCEIVGTRLSRTVWGFSAAELATVTSPDLKQKAFPEAISACAETSLGLGATVVPWCPPSHSVLNLRAAILRQLISRVPWTVRSPSRSLVWVSVARTTATSGSGDCASGSGAGGPSGSVFDCCSWQQPLPRACAVLFTHRADA